MRTRARAACPVLCDVLRRVSQTISRMSPTSLAVSLRQLRLGSKLDLDECLKMEYRISQVMMQRKDFYEGIRAVLVDRDNKPVWGPEESVDDYFASLGDKELVLPTKVLDPPEDMGLVTKRAVDAAIESGIAPHDVAGIKAHVGFVDRPGNQAKLVALLGAVSDSKL